MSKTRILSLVLLLSLVLTSQAGAQAATSVRVNYSEVTENPDTLTLGIYFTLIDDSNGKAITNPSIQSAEITILDQAVTYPAEARKADTPFYIVLVLDASGSMQRAAEDLRNAASQAISSPPQGARFAVVKFNDQIELLQDFTENRDPLQRAISEVVPEYNAGTCLYDAAYSAVDMLAKTPPGRRAVILFTDGKDETAEGKVCSSHTFNEVVDYANQYNLHVPIHTIGLAANVNAINSSELSAMASTTGGFSAVGSQASLGSLFKEIMDAINSQWLAQANMYPTKGQHNAVLTVKLRDGNTVTATVSFTSSRDYYVPPEPVSMLLDGVEYITENKIYRVHLSFVSPQLIGSVKVAIWNEEDGVLVSEKTFTEVASPSTFEMAADALKNETDYQFKIGVYDPQGLPIKNEKGEPLSITHDFRYNIEIEVIEVIKTSLKIPLVSVSPTALTIKVEVTGDEPVASYEGWLKDESNNAEVTGSSFTLSSLPSSKLISIPMEGIATGKYTVVLRALGKDGQTLAEAEYTGVVYVPPKEQSGFSKSIERIVNGLKTHPWIIVAIVAILCTVILFFIILALRFTRSTGTPVLQGKIEAVLGQDRGQPPVNMTRVDVGTPVAPDRIPAPVAPVRKTPPAATLRFKATPNPANQGKVLGITRLPFALGREDCDLNVLGDRKVSRKHARITFDPQTGLYYVMDLGSSNGMWVDGIRSIPNKPVELVPGSVISLGPDTQLVFEEH